jgi:hypothetical protein
MAIKSGFVCDAQTPYVLRLATETSNFTLIRDCDVHDFMHGETLDDRWGLKGGIGILILFKTRN